MPRKKILSALSLCLSAVCLPSPCSLPMLSLHVHAHAHVHVCYPCCVDLFADPSIIITVGILTAWLRFEREKRCGNPQPRPRVFDFATRSAPLDCRWNLDTSPLKPRARQQSDGERDVRSDGDARICAVHTKERKLHYLFHTVHEHTTKETKA